MVKSNGSVVAWINSGCDCDMRREEIVTNPNQITCGGHICIAWYPLGKLVYHYNFIVNLFGTRQRPAGGRGCRSGARQAGWQRRRVSTVRVPPGSEEGLETLRSRGAAGAHPPQRTDGRAPGVRGWLMVGLGA